jgi:hypothetical protein
MDGFQIDLTVPALIDTWVDEGFRRAMIQINCRKIN